MEKVINLIYDIEEKANQIVKRASEEKIRLYEALQKDLEQLDQTIETEKAAKLRDIQVQADKDLEKDRQNLFDDYNRQITNMDNYYIDNKEVLIDKIFYHIIES